ncbi:MAG: N-acetylmuramoyl-L-alanine amidase [Flavobacteriaceae bacterium]|nr:N-acetylmuramoyl-L-alanine amidase [Flavobacteriaceae bacterium]
MQTRANYLLVFFILLLTYGSFGLDSDPPDAKKFVIMIDPGHGGRDGGTPGTGRYKTTEKDIALDVSLGLGKLLESELSYVEVLYTRSKDVFPTLKSRPIAANEKGADLFISIHCNAQPGRKGTAYGSETYVLGLHKTDANLEVAKRENSVIFLEEDYEETYQGFDPNSPESLIGLMIMQEDYLDQSIELASYIENEFKTTAKRKSRGVKQAGFWVLAQTYMPSVLVELGFLTHRKEEDYLNSSKGKRAMTRSLFNAVKRYVDLRIDQQQEIAMATTEGTNGNTVADTALYTDITFKVQIAASSRNLETKPFNFKGLDDLSKEKRGKIYRYFYGATSDLNEIERKKIEAIKKGYSTAFIVAFKNGERIPMNTVLKTTSN